MHTKSTSINVGSEVFLLCNNDLFNGPSNGQPSEFDNDNLKSLVKAYPKLSLEQLSRSRGYTWDAKEDTYVELERHADKE